MFRVPLNCEIINVHLEYNLLSVCDLLFTVSDQLLTSLYSFFLWLVRKESRHLPKCCCDVTVYFMPHRQRTLCLSRVALLNVNCQWNLYKPGEECWCAVSRDKKSHQYSKQWGNLMLFSAFHMFSMNYDEYR